MNNKLFSSTPGGLIPPTNAKNLAGGVAYNRTPEESLAQLAATGCFGDTFYASAEDQLQQLLDVAAKCQPEWIAKCAIYARQRGLMKDMPAVLTAVLAARDIPLFKRVFPKTIDNVKMLRNFVQTIRSGVVGRKSFGSAVKARIRSWLDSRSEEALFHASIGDKPSLADIIKMVHPKPRTEVRRLMYAYLIGKPVAALGLLPEVVQQFEALKLGLEAELPDINFQFLSTLNLSTEQWALIAQRASWTTLRMNLNTFQRHGVFDNIEVLGKVIERMRNVDEIKRAKPMPHQLFAAFMNLAPEVPAGIKMGIAQGLEIALSNVPKLPPRTVIGVDVSGSMSSPWSGQRGTKDSNIRCVDIAALFAVAVLRTTPTARLVAFDTTAHKGQLGGSLGEAAAALARLGGGGTDCSIPLRIAAEQKEPVDAVILVSDNESWFGNANTKHTSVMAAFRQLQRKNPEVKLVCIDLTPNATTQVVTADKNILNVGGFSDAVFDVVSGFLNNATSWMDIVSAVDIDAAKA